MIDLLSTQKALIAPHLFPGAAAADFTMGNGHDTLWLSEQVGETGRVYAFDIQDQALSKTAALLKEHGRENVTLIHDSHANAKAHIPEPLAAGLFNLGWLPGGDKSVTTRRESTLPAIRAALELLAPGGALLVAVYPGHPEGAAEGELIREELSALSRFAFCATLVRIVNSPAAPFFFLIEKKES